MEDPKRNDIKLKYAPIFTDKSISRENRIPFFIKKGKRKVSFYISEISFNT